MVRLNLTTVTSGQANEVKRDSFAVTKSLLCNENAFIAISRDMGPLSFLGNQKIMDCVSLCQVNLGVTLSDRFPLELTLSLPVNTFRVVRWPERGPLPETLLYPNIPLLLPQGCSFAALQRRCLNWIEASYEIQIPPRKKA